MHLSCALSFFALFSLVASAPLMKPRDCPVIPSSPNPDVLKQVYDIAMSRGLDDKLLLATFETAWVESRVNNLDCGDQDSVGVFQQRPSQGWGNVEQIEDVIYSTNLFLDHLIPTAQNSPDLTAGQLAQSVQRSEFPFRYDEAEANARVRRILLNYLNRISRNTSRTLLRRRKVLAADLPQLLLQHLLHHLPITLPVRLHLAAVPPRLGPLQARTLTAAKFRTVRAAPLPVESIVTPPPITDGRRWKANWWSFNVRVNHSCPNCPTSAHWATIANSIWRRWRMDRSWSMLIVSRRVQCICPRRH